ncbi:MAG: hypothetical protein JSV86_19905 [Gemmatimonadota bacterium]|nr:MAG: hypothetical protein JSV86_19905 [Gemmatimonadota bacterium]
MTGRLVLFRGVGSPTCVGCLGQTSPEERRADIGKAVLWTGVAAFGLFGVVAVGVMAWLELRYHLTGQ